MQKVKTCLWFDNRIEEAVNLYVSLIKNSKVNDVSRYPEGAPVPAGTALTATFELDGVEFMALNGGPQYTFTEASSMYVDCADQAEVDRLWNALTAEGGEESMCGWLKDKYGLSWQIVPKQFGELMGDPDPAKSQAVMNAMLQMRKIDVAGLQKAYDAVTTG
jgi:predicted 3-demethylubiquinone-9 3-methyltransferase (glyoxalase superfamily)